MSDQHDNDDTRDSDPNTPTPIVHVYDGDLVEEDNRLPLWWQYTLYGAIVFAAVYWYGEHQLGAWKGQSDAFQQEMIGVRLEQAKKAGGKLPPEALIAMSKNPATVDQGKSLFVTTCAQCHRADGGGNIGPNLTDEFWLHGGKPENIQTSVNEGYPLKGMPNWQQQLGEEKTTALIAYVISLKGTNAPNGKAPQGEKE
jgi:cytochrome c oxidase cbb3-type subunit 3